MTTSVKNQSLKSHTISAEVIHEEDEEAFASVINMGSKNVVDKDEGLTQEEQEGKRKGIRDMIFKSEYNLGGVIVHDNEMNNNVDNGN